MTQHRSQGNRVKRARSGRCPHLARFTRLPRGLGDSKVTNPAPTYKKSDLVVVHDAPMSCDANTDCRHKIPGTRYRMTTWPSYDAAPARRGNLKVRATDEAMPAWPAPAAGIRGGQPLYPLRAKGTGRVLPLVLHPGLARIEAALGPSVHLLGIGIEISGHTTFSRHANGLALLTTPVERGAPPHLPISGAGLRMYGEGQRLEEKPEKRSRWNWHKLRLAINASRDVIERSPLAFRSPFVSGISKNNGKNQPSMIHTPVSRVERGSRLRK